MDQHDAAECRASFSHSEPAGGRQSAGGRRLELWERTCQRGTLRCCLRLVDADCLTLLPVLAHGHGIVRRQRAGRGRLEGIALPEPPALCFPARSFTSLLLRPGVVWEPSPSREQGGGGQTPGFTVNFAVSGTATAGSDYQALSGTVAFGSADSVTRTIMVLDDTEVELDETVVVTLTEGDIYNVGSPSSAVVTIADNDAPSAGLANGGFESEYQGWSASGNQQISSRASEGVKAVQFNSGQTSPNGVLVQNFATTPGQSYSIAMDVGADWGTTKTQQRLQVTLQGVSTLLSETVVVFGTGNSSSKYISTNFTFVADSANTTLTFQDVSTTGLNVDLLLDNLRVVTSASTVQFAAATYAVAENEGSVRVYVTRTGASPGPASVVYATADETAIAGQDYTAVSGTLNWAAGDTEEKFFDVPIIDDSSSDGDQTFTLRLSGATGATLGSPNAAIVTVTDWEPGKICYRSTSLSLPENGGSLRVWVRRIEGSSGIVTAGFFTTNKYYGDEVWPPATPGEDFEPVQGTLTWGDGDDQDKYFDVPILDDTLHEGDESFYVVLSGSGIWSTPSKAVLISDDDLPGVPVITVTATDPNASEDGPGPLVQGRYGHTATLLADGKVLVTGGNNRLSSSELYDPASSTWTACAPMNTARDYHTATLLPNGKVLVAGGGSSAAPLVSAELFNPADGTWTPTGDMNRHRQGHTATLLPDGKVLVAGGDWDAIPSAELYDPATGAWTPTGNLNRNRNAHTATLLPNGKVLVSGGWDYPGGDPDPEPYPDGIAFSLDIFVVRASSELYDPVTKLWTLTGPMAAARESHTATLLPNGMVLAAGGGRRSNGAALSLAELYDPAAGTWTNTEPLNAARTSHTANLLADGKVLVAGGWSDGNVLASAELYDAASGLWTQTASHSARYWHTATALSDGSVLVVGGSAELSSAELYLPAAETWVGLATFTFSRTGNKDWITANIALSGTATAGNDYQALSSTIDFGSADSVTKTIMVLDDSEVESDETVVVTLLPGDGYAVGSPSSAVVTIADNDAPSAGLVNGGFESDYQGWSASGNQQISGRASEGTKAVQFNSGQTSPNGVLTQSFATTPGQSYTIAMDVGADWGTTKTQQRLQVTCRASPHCYPKRSLYSGRAIAHRSTSRPTSPLSPTAQAPR